MTSSPFEDGGDRVVQLACPSGFAFRTSAGGELVVDPAVIADPPLRVDHERLGRHRRADLAGEGAVAVADHRELEAEVAGVRLHVGVAQVGVDADADHFTAGAWNASNSELSVGL